jgi:DNA-binding NtrC family response regulator
MIGKDPDISIGETLILMSTMLSSEIRLAGKSVSSSPASFLSQSHLGLLSMVADRSLIVISHSEKLLAQFESLEIGSSEDESALLLSPDETALVKQKLDFESPVLLVLDLRPQFRAQDLIPVLNLLDETPDANWKLLAVTSGVISLKIAGMLSRLVDGYLDERRDCANVKQLESSLIPYLNDEIASTRLRGGYYLQAGDVELRTYTPAMVPLLGQLSKIARHDVTLMLIGETGTGKTTLAKLMHRMSRRKEATFHTVACGALPKDLIESELFGHARGAFTGAERSRIGRFEAANGGTLLLDEIDLLGPSEQAKLLRVIETGEYEKIGSTDTLHSSARTIVASNIGLDELMDQEKFRADLYYRLNVLQFRLLPLSERPHDILPLAIDFIESFCSHHDITIDYVRMDFLEALQTYAWPGNLRELKNQVARASMMAEGKELRLCDLTPEVQNSEQSVERKSNAATTCSDDTNETLADQVANNEREILIDALKANNFKRIETAKSLGISRVGLYKKMKKYELLDDQQSPKDAAQSVA